MKKLYNLPCNIAQILNLIGDKWTLLILWQLKLGNNTYSKLQNRLEGIASNLLSNRLKSLEEDGLISMELYQKHPPRYQYLLTEKGHDLNNVFNSLILWGEKHIKGCNKHLAHKTCGHNILLYYYCPDCQKTIEQNEIKISQSE